MGRTIENLQADIDTGVGELVAGEGWQRWLSVAARFPKYSFRNQLLILHQRPDARVVMGYRTWQALGHQVRRGEQSISILAPCTYKEKTRTKTQTGELGTDAAPSDTETQTAGVRRVLRGFRVAHVFDIAQTDGDGVQPPEQPQLLDGEAPAGLWDTLADQVAAAGFTLTRADITSGANGVTNFEHRTVTVAPHLSAAQAAKTLAHD